MWAGIKRQTVRLFVFNENSRKVTKLVLENYINVCYKYKVGWLLSQCQDTLVQSGNMSGEEATGVRGRESATVEREGASGGQSGPVRAVVTVPLLCPSPNAHAAPLLTPLWTVPGFWLEV